MAKSCTRTGSGCPFGRSSRPPFLKSPTNSFFLVSTEIAGSPAAWNSFTAALMCSNWASRSGWLAPSRVLRLACRLNPRRGSSRPTSFCPAAKPRSAKAADRWRWLLLTHRNGASGSPRIDSGSPRIVTPDRGLHQVVQRLEKPGLGLGRRLAAASRSAHPMAERLGACPQVRQATADRAAGNPSCAGHRLDPTACCGPGLARREQAPTSFVQKRGERIQAGLDGGEVDHRTRVDLQAPRSHSFRVTFRPFLTPPEPPPAGSVIRARVLSGSSGKSCSLGQERDAGLPVR